MREHPFLIEMLSLKNTFRFVISFPILLIRLCKNQLDHALEKFALKTKVQRLNLKVILLDYDCMTLSYNAGSRMV